MVSKFQYYSQDEKNSIILEQQDKYLIEVQDLFEGSFLIFSDKPRPIEPIYIDISRQELEDVKIQLADVNIALASIMGV